MRFTNLLAVFVLSSAIIAAPTGINEERSPVAKVPYEYTRRNEKLERRCSIEKRTAEACGYEYTKREATERPYEYTKREATEHPYEYTKVCF